MALFNCNLAGGASSGMSKGSVNELHTGGGSGTASIYTYTSGTAKSFNCASAGFCIRPNANSVEVVITGSASSYTVACGIKGDTVVDSANVHAATLTKVFTDCDYINVTASMGSSLGTISLKVTDQ